MADKYTKYFAMLPSDVMAIDHTVLNATAKLVYSIIFTMLNTRDKFYMSNKIIGERLGQYKPTNISRCVSRLEELGLIKVEMLKNENGGYAGRLVSLGKYPIENNTRGYGTKVQGGLVQKYKGALYDSTNKYISENKLVNKLDKEGEQKPSHQKSKTYDDNSDYMKLAKFLLKEIQNNDPKFKKDNLQRWADDFRKLVELDKRSPKQVAQVIKLVQNDEFWKTNILSAAKLRKQYPRFAIKVADNNKRSHYTGQIIKQTEDNPDIPH